ncbi:MAG: lipoyl(octanoyl) transferase LipB [Actinobacteria bacterium]|nr:lipoyl(octanoyl) transferase LipB [Actinomycetota bacterium]
MSSGSSQISTNLDVRRIDLGHNLVDYQVGWELQRQIHAEVLLGTTPPTVLLLEHAQVYTAGKRTQLADRPTDGSPVVDVDRGGRITWHGPGQLVAYPIVPLPHPMDVVAHVRRLETAIMATCADSGIATSRIPGRSGVWCLTEEHEVTAESKIAAIGIRVARGITMHGLALNIDCDLGWGEAIVPCGIPDASVTSMVVQGALRETAHTDRFSLVADQLELHLREVLEPTLPSSQRRVG